MDGNMSSNRVTHTEPRLLTNIILITEKTAGYFARRSRAVTNTTQAGGGEPRTRRPGHSAIGCRFTPVHGLLYTS